jgi:hypothetical protein
VVRLLIILLVILIPLRGWSAERIVVKIAYSQAVEEAVGEHIAMAGMPLDCPMLTQLVAKTDRTSSPAKGSADCQTCQPCMTLASPNLLQTQLALDLVEVHPQSPSATFVSADVAPQVKPPIS